MPKKTVRDVEVEGKRVLVRVDLNVPLAEGEVADDTRIRESLPTVRYLLERGAKVILLSHLGRPAGQPVDSLRLDPVARSLSRLLGMPVRKLDDCTGAAVETAVEEMAPGEVVLLENTRFHAGEMSNDAGFAAALAGYAELFVNDAFGSAHRDHASVVGVAENLPSVAGLLMEKEIENLSRAAAGLEHPYVAIVGGAKVSDKIGVLRALSRKADTLMLGGGIASTFFLAKGWEIGKSLAEPEARAEARAVMRETGDRLVLPSDVVISPERSDGAGVEIVDADQIPAWAQIVDIGPRTVSAFVERLEAARLVVWSGPLGVFEVPEFAEGTMAVARAVARLDATVIVGGGDSAAAMARAGVSDRVTHVSTGGGAALRFLQGETLPGIAALEDR
ncbi:MAG: phosphoglycerate kinase [Anaerolineae bacterium]